MALRGSLGLVLVAIAGASLVLTAAGQQQAWPPPVQRVPEISPALSAEEEIKTFYLPPGYRVELVAKEPLVQDPIAMDYDADGRLFVLEMPGFAFDETMADSREPIGRVVRLEDTNGDGRMDARTVFLDGLVLPRALKVLDRGVLVGAPPHLWLAQDTNGDGRAETKTLVRDDFGRRDGNLEHDANGLLWAMDNVIYTSEHDWHLRPRNGTFTIEPTLPRGQWGLSMDDAGRLFRNFNTEALFVDLVPARYFMRNPHLVRTRGLYESLVDPNRTAIWPVRPTRGINRGYREGLLRPDGTAAYYAGVSSPLIFRGDRLPADLAGDAFVVDSPTHLVHRLKVVDDGRGRLSAHDAYEKGEFLASTDERFRPVNLYSAPDGTLQIVDMYRGVVQDARFQTEYLRDYIVKHRLALPVGLGRIFRVVHESMRPGERPALSAKTPGELTTYLSHPNGWWRDTAQRLLVERGASSVAPALTALARQATDARTRLHALWTLDGLDAIECATVMQALRDASPAVRASALRLSERWLRDPAGATDDAGAASANRSSTPGASDAERAALRSAVLWRMADDHTQVRRQLAATLGELPAANRLEPLVTLLQRFGDDPIVVDAALSGVAGLEARVLDQLLARAAHPARDDAMAMLAGAAARGGDTAAIERLVAQATDDARPPAERLALLSGIEAGLSLTTDITANRGGLPAGTTGRAAIAGGSMSSASSPSASSTARLAAQARPLTAFAAEPIALTQLAAGKGEQAQLAAQIVSRITWPGKPVPAGPVVPPLTAAEQTRYDAGSEIYKNICVACHQPDGRGKDKVAPALAGSVYTLGPPGVPARILLAGKDGRTGLMPPLGTLTDEQIAAVLTYVRRAWSNGSSAVDPALVKEIRALTASHARPWTDAELTPLVSPPRD